MLRCKNANFRLTDAASKFAFCPAEARRNSKGVAVSRIQITDAQGHSQEKTNETEARAREIFIDKR